MKRRRRRRRASTSLELDTCDRVDIFEVDLLRDCCTPEFDKSNKDRYTVEHFGSTQALRCIVLSSSSQKGQTTCAMASGTPQITSSAVADTAKKTPHTK